MSNNHEIKWNRKRHDERIEKTDEEISKAKGMKIFQKHYHAWRQLFRKKKGMSVQEIKDSLLDLRGLVTKEMNGIGLGPWVEFSCKLIDEKLLELDTVLIAGRNRIVQYMPRLPGATDAINSSLPSPLQTAEQKRGAVEANFQTEEELRAIPWIKTVTEKEGFIGFTLDGPKLVALFDDEETVPVGVVSCGIGLERIPSLHDFATALKGTLDASAASAPSEPTGKPGPTPARRSRPSGQSPT